MNLFSRSEPYTPIMRKPNKNKPLTPEEAKHILDNPYPTGYTYANSASYSANKPREYIHPNLSRSSLLSNTSSSSNNSSAHSSSFYDKDGENDERKCFWPLIIGMICLGLLLWRIHPQQHYLASTGTCTNAAKDVLYSLQNLQCSLNKEADEFYPPALPPNTTSPTQSISGRHQWDKEIDKIRKEIASIANTLQKIDDDRAEVVDEQVKKHYEQMINELFEKERQILRDELEHSYKKAADEQNTTHHRSSNGPSEEEMAKLVQDSINKIDFTSVVDEIVRSNVNTQMVKVEQHSMKLIEKQIRTTISEELRKYSYDKTGEADFALESAGGYLLSTRNTKEYNPLPHRDWFFWLPYQYNLLQPRIVIQRKSQNVNAGECWSIEGSKANLVIKLARKISVTAITYEHLPRELSPAGNINSAPKMFNVYSLQNVNDENKVLIGKYMFDAEAEPLQRFVADRYDPRGTSIIEFEFQSNHGALFTCLYRLRVHGNPL